MEKIRVLLAGESWVSTTTHYKGWDFFSSAVYETGIDYMSKTLIEAGFDFTHLPGHLAATEFPFTLEGLRDYDAIILSDLGSNTLLLHPDTWLHGKSMPNRLKLIKQWVSEGGGFMMCGGYYSFAGIYGQAKYYHTPIEEILPVNIHTFDDRIEAPEGLVPELIMPDHPILKDIPHPFPHLLGFNELTLKEDAQLIAEIGGFPLLATKNFEKGKTMIWSSDIGPHWCPETFIKWEGYGRLWCQSLQWLSGKKL